MTYREAKMEVMRHLKDAGIENELAESGFLMEFVCQTDRSFYLLHQMEEMPKEHQKAFFELAAQRCSHIPLQYLTGEQEFMGISFKVNEHVLIPRQDTEILVEEACRILRGWKETCPDNAKYAFNEKGTDLRVLDMCTGSGCIAVSLKAFCPEIQITGCDISPKALAVAKENAALHHLDVEFAESDLFSGISGKYHMIVSNPPYIPRDVIPTLMPEVREHEPVRALDGMADGLYFYREIISRCSDYLLPEGYLLFEIGYDQKEAVTEMMKKQNFTDIEVLADLAGLDRVVKGRRMKHV